MASNYTSNYNLNQWSASDRVLRTEFNADNLLFLLSACGGQQPSVPDDTPETQTVELTVWGGPGRTPDRPQRQIHPPPPQDPPCTR